MEFKIEDLRKNLSMEFVGKIGVTKEYKILWKGKFIGHGLLQSNQPIKNETQMGLILGIHKERIINKFNDLWSFIGFVGQLKEEIKKIEGAQND